ncbi:MAG: DNA polymerase III subunit delta [Hyphomicrobium sp.]
MVAVKAHQAAAFLKSGASKHTAFLLFGTDSGLVSERAAHLARAASALSQPPGEILRLDDSDLENDPGRLSLELGTIAMFGGRKVIRASTGRRINTNTIKPLLDGPPLEGVLIVEAGNLKTEDSLRSLFERSDRAAAIACYADDVQDLDALMREVLTAASLTISADARDLLVSRLGADRVMSRSEIEKLALYAGGKTQIDAADVDAIVGDASELALDRIVTSAASGLTARTVTEFSRAISAGESAQSIILAVERYFHRLHRVRAAIDRGKSFDEAVRALKPQLHFKQKDAFSAQLRMWTSAKLLSGLAAIASAAKSARLAGQLEDAHAERLLLGLAALARDTGNATPAQKPR